MAEKIMKLDLPPKARSDTLRCYAYAWRYGPASLVDRITEKYYALVTSCLQQTNCNMIPTLLH